MSTVSEEAVTLEAELPSFSLAGKTAFVTGSSRGIGRSIALALASAGADVAISCNTGGSAALEVCNAIHKLGRKAELYAHNIAVEAEVEAMCNEFGATLATSTSWSTTPGSLATGLSRSSPRRPGTM